MIDHSGFDIFDSQVRKIAQMIRSGTTHEVPVLASTPTNRPREDQA
jgi:hypothetical protein